MNILILQGSPRANGNTAWMAEEYKIDELKTEEIRQKVIALANKL